MKKTVRDVIENWPKNFIQYADLVMIFKDKTDDARYSFVKRVLKDGLLTRIKRGLYIITRKIKPLLVETFELSMVIYEPSFVSLESALSYHDWIPEGVYVKTCVSIKRAKEFKTPVGVFSYERVPEKKFYIGVERIKIKGGAFFIASAWRALADFMYTRRKSWKNLDELEQDMRIDKETVFDSDINMLKLLSESYPSKRVRDNLKRLLKEVCKTTRVSV